MNKQFKMVIFDMDGVIADVKSSWSYVHKKFNINNEDNIQSYLRGKIDYNEFMRKDIKLWGLRNIDDIKNILKDVKLITGSKHTVKELKKRGYEITLLSAGISLLADMLNREFNFDYVLANILCTDEEGYLTGEGKTVVELLSKEAAAKKLIKKTAMSPKECVAIGDSQYDVPIFKMVGLSIAFNTDNISVKQAANKVINKKDLREILQFLP